MLLFARRTYQQGGILLIWPTQATRRLYFCLRVGHSTRLPYCPCHYPGVCTEIPLLPLKEKLNLLFPRNSILPLKQLVLVLIKKRTAIAGNYTPKWYPSGGCGVGGRAEEIKKNLASIWDQLLHPVLMFWAICPSKEPSVKGLHILGFCQPRLCSNFTFIGVFTIIIS